MLQKLETKIPPGILCWKGMAQLCFKLCWNLKLLNTHFMFCQNRPQVFVASYEHSRDQNAPSKYYCEGQTLSADSTVWSPECLSDIRGFIFSLECHKTNDMQCSGWSMPLASIHLKMFPWISQFDIICMESFMTPTEHFFYERNFITEHCLNKELGWF